jgi:transposase
VVATPRTHDAPDTRGRDKLFVDYSGKRPHITDPQTGECTDLELFVAVLGASNYTYGEAARSQRVHDFGSHVRALAFFGGVPRLLVPDRLRRAVRVPCSYEPGMQRIYEELAKHYGTAVMPARAGRPRDKSKGRSRCAGRTTLGLHERIAEFCDDLNHRKMRRYGESRRQLFERIERTALSSLRAERHGSKSLVETRS